MSDLPRFFRTVRHLKFRQVFWRLYRRVGRIRLHAAAAARRAPVAAWTAPIARESGIEDSCHLRLLNTSVDISDAACWGDSRLARLMLYKLHYLDELEADPGDGAEATRASLLGRWIAENPPTQGVGWEPYPLSLRIVNIVKWALRRGGDEPSVDASLHQQAQALSQQIEYHILGNHILENAKALFFAGCFFEGRDAERWLRQSYRLLAAELDEQILPDGGHFERSPMYQAILLEDVLDLISISRSYRLAPPVDLAEIAGRMLAWLSVMTHPDGEVAYFNDATAGASPTVAALRDYHRRLELGGGSPPPAAADLRDSGYARRSIGDLTVLIDAGEIGPDYQPGHAHCDCLSFELSRGARRILVNTGVSTYEAGDRRDLERSTRAHNTVSVNGAEQIEFWGGFRVGRRAYPRRVVMEPGRVAAEHDGFRHLGVVHRRRFEFSGDSVRIEDTIGGSNAAGATAVAYFHFHPSIDAIIDGATVSFPGGSLAFTGHELIAESGYEYCRGFYSREQATMFSVTFRGRLETRIDSTPARPQQ